MKPWEKAFKWIGVAAIIVLVVFVVQQYFRTVNYKAGLKNLDAALSQIPVQNGRQLNLTQGQKKSLIMAINKLGKPPRLSLFSASAADGARCIKLISTALYLWEIGEYEAAREIMSFAFAEGCYESDTIKIQKS